MKWLQAHYKDVDRMDRLAEASGFLGRDVDSFSSLSKADASLIIDELERRAQELADVPTVADGGLFGSNDQQ